MNFDKNDVKKRIEAGARLALENFDVGAVCAVMHALNWCWPVDEPGAEPRVPTARQVEKVAAELLARAVDKFVDSCGAEEAYIATGGLCARVCDYCVSITFEAVVGEACAETCDGHWDS